MKLVEIRSEIVSGVFSNEDLDTISQAVSFARGQLAKKNTRAFRYGDLVKFTSNRNGRVYQGTVEKVNIKNIIVTTALGKYRVPANMLESV
jgi:hypothetical protein